jgi:carboxypeptidase family protein
MTKQRVVFIIAGAVVVMFGIVLWLLHSSPPSVPQIPPTPSPVTQAEPTITPSSYPSATPSLLVDNLTGETMTREAALKSYVARFSTDPTWEGKVPLNFYGKVVDQNNQPVAGANVHLQWNTIGVPGGTAYADTSSDTNGLFSLTGQHGKNLEVSVKKDGYYSADRGGSYLSFEYANPSDPGYYAPDANNPVLFHLRQKGMNAATLLHWKRDVALNGQNQKALDLKTGQTTQGQSPSLFIEVLENNSKPGSFAWSARVSVVGGGGLQLATDQFAFLAPTSGYQPSVEVNMTTPKPPNWNAGQGGVFYVQTPEGYGRYTVSMDLGVHWIEAEGFLNPTSGDRNLEPASQ